jgi:hypothetical protein
MAPEADSEESKNICFPKLAAILSAAGGSG